MPLTTEAKFEKAYRNAGGSKALPWALIIQAIIALLPLICPAAMAKKWAKRNPEAAKEAIENALKSEDGVAMSSGDRELVVDSAYDTFLKMSPAEISELRR